MRWTKSNENKYQMIEIHSDTQEDNRGSYLSYK